MTDVDTLLEDGEQLVVAAGELIYRQIASWMVQNGSIQTSAFGPSTSDNGRASYTRSSLVTAQESRDWHDRYARSASIGVWALTIDEVHEQDRLVVDDSRTPLAVGQVRPPGHCYVDFRGLSRPELKSVRYHLYRRAMERGEIPTEATVADGQLFQ